MIVTKTTKDYLDDLCEMYPSIKRDDLLRICNYGWKILYLLNSYGADVCIATPNLWTYFGNMYKDSLKFYEHYRKKLALKFRILYKRNKVEWDGYYYFGLTDSLYLNYASLINKKGRKKKWFTFNKIMLYKILDECKVLLPNAKYIFKVKMPFELSPTIFKYEFKTDKAELIIERDTLKLKDLLISNNNYELL